MPIKKCCPTVVPILFFALYLWIGWSIFADYGIYWDDQVQLKNGLIAVDYVNQQLGHFLDIPRQVADEHLPQYENRAYGTWFQVGCFFLLHGMGLEDSRDVFLLRHFCTFLLFWLAGISFYRLLLFRFQNRMLALLGCTMLILSPRIFAHSFYNGKDIVFLSVMLLGTWFAILLLQKPRLWRILLAALTAALAIDTRVTGILLPALTLLFLVYTTFISLSENHLSGNRQKKELIFRFFKTIALYIIVLVGCIILFWPTLWENPFDNFVQAFERMSQHKFQGHIRYFNSRIKGSEAPWHYTLGWMAVTTPLLYLLLFLAGAGSTLKAVFVNLKKYCWKTARSSQQMTDQFLLCLFVGPLVAVVWFQSTLYDGWRQMYFIYPAVVYLAVKGVGDASWGIRKYCRPIIASRILLSGKILLIVYLLLIGAKMWQDHPHQYVYFNLAAGTNVETRFELDYWGLSCKQSLEYLLDTDTAAVIPIFVSSGLQNTALILPPHDRKRIRYAKRMKRARYFILHNRAWGQRVVIDNNQYPFQHPLFTMRPGGNLIGGVYLLEPDTLN